MASQQDVLETQVRTQFGKGASRRDRRDGLIPAVLYGHNNDPIHLNLPAAAFATILRAHGTNAVVNLKIGDKNQLALTKQIVVHPLRNYIEHVDFLVVRRGEKVTVEVSIVVEGTAAPGTSVSHDANTLEIQAEPFNIPEHIIVNIEGANVGTQILAGQVLLPAGVDLVSNPETLVVNITEIADADLGDSDESSAAQDDQEGAAEND